MAFDYDLEQHKSWLGFLQPVGLVVSPHALVNKGVVLAQDVAELQQRFVAAAPAPDEDAEPGIASFPGFAREVLGWPLDQLAGAPGGPALPELEVVLPEHRETLQPTYALLDGAGAPLLPVWMWPRGTDLDRAPEAHAEGWQASPQAKLERLLRERKLFAALLSNGTQLRLVVAPPGESSGHLTFPLPALCLVAGRQLLAALHMLLGGDRLLNVPVEHRLPALLRDSRKYQNQVSVKLAEQVLQALWELLRGFQAADALAQGRILGELSREDPPQIYGGLLAVLLRLVFLLYTEHRGLMPDNEVFRENYSLGGLYERLRTDHGRNPDTIDQRYGAWACLLTLFRLIHRGGGHGRFRLPAREGDLFDPQRHPFLEGVLVAHDTVERFEAPRVSDGCVLRVLERLLVLDGERLSYRTLDVEQIGSVYEAMMGFAVERTQGRSIAVRPEDVVIDIDQLLGTAPADRKKQLKELANCDLPDKAAAQLRDAKTPDGLVAALGSRKSPRTPDVLPAGALYLQPGEERRRSGSHYTPRELTEPIVRTTLRPALEVLGSNPRPEQILALKVCDPAMGSGAFLVEACRQLAEQLVAAWERHASLPKLAPDEDPLLHARRMVAQRCLYGVDKNPFAVGLAKLSLWLVTLARDHAFTFLDHALKHGDSLVGLTRAQIERFDFRSDGDEGPLFEGVRKSAREAAALRSHIGESVDGAIATQQRELREADEAVAEARFIGDLAVLAFFEHGKPKARRDRLLVIRDEIRRAREEEQPALEAALRAHLTEAREAHPPLVPFHWEIEFPEVFDREQPGFDAIVGNPPFAGKNTLKDANGEGYIDWLKALHEESHGAADLVAHFFRRAFALLRPGGSFGLIATITIAQGETRATGLRWICTHGGSIFAVRRRYRWPLPGAAVIVSVVHMLKGALSGRPLLDGKAVERISAFLFHKGGDDNPSPLHANAGKSFIGSYVLGMGFTFDDSDKSGEASSLAEMHRLIEKNARNRERIFPYLSNEELNDSPTQAHHRYVINFGQMSEEEARAGWPELMAIIEAKVRGRRGSHSTAPWFQFERPRLELFAALRDLEAREAPEVRQVLVVGRRSETLGFVFGPPRAVYSEDIVVFALSSYLAFACLSTQVHAIWARLLSPGSKVPQYAPTDAFETFPFPPAWETNAALEAAGRAYYDFRSALMIKNDEGLTKICNRFHDPNEQGADIARLRELQAGLDRAVLDAYGWSDIPTVCDFEPEYEPEEGEPEGRTRYRWPAEMRDEVLARLLELNRLRAEEEQKSGAVAEKKPNAPKKIRSKKKSSTPDLFED